MADVFCAAGPGQRVHRAVSGSLLAGGEYRQLQEIAVPFPYRGQPAAWGGGRARRPPAGAGAAGWLPRRGRHRR